MNQNRENQKKNNDEEDEKPLVEENIKIHQISSPTVGKKHDWIQQGPHLICRSCESPHGFRIGVNKRLKGFDDKGNMLIENV